MRRLFLFIATIVLIVTIGGSLIFWGKGGVFTPGSFEQDKVVVISRGSGLMTISRKLTDDGVLNYPLPFVIAATLMGKNSSLKPGEYRIPRATTPAKIAEIIASGQTVTHTLTIPEGYTVHQIAEIIKENPRLEGEIGPLPSEGHLLPESYHYKLWDARATMVKRMKRSMDEALQDCWSRRSATCPLADPDELLTLASIVEKETGIPSERPEIAGVFINRLVKGIRLQADPTVIYGITNGKGALGRKLLRADLNADTPYNTYTNKGLPPTPIACPGKAALYATARPKETQSIYFVADGTGGHTFSKTLAEHNTRVNKWRVIRKAKEKAEKATFTSP